LDGLFKCLQWQGCGSSSGTGSSPVRSTIDYSLKILDRVPKYNQDVLYVFNAQINVLSKFSRLERPLIPFVFALVVIQFKFTLEYQAANGFGQVG
jgi:hypothetical protein